jgi:hypothetical protein
MKNAQFSRLLFTCLALFSIHASAALVSMDWKTSGDGLITHDTATGLDWLDLTQTNDMSRDYVLTQLVSDGQFAGMRYATTNEVLGLWSTIGIDLFDGAYYFGQDPLVAQATQLLGNVYCEYDCSSYPYGVTGLTADLYTGYTDLYQRLGAMVSNQTASEPERTWYENGTFTGNYSDTSEVWLAHYLVRASVSSVSSVPVPASVWLFGSGLLGLAGVSRRTQFRSNRVRLD